jgi:hypothetical protein
MCLLPLSQAHDISYLRSNNLYKGMLTPNHVQVDLSRDGGKGLKWGEETLFVNASIMNVFYRPKNAPWLVDLDLPVADANTPGQHHIMISPTMSYTQEIP